MNHPPHGEDPQFWDPDATTLLPPAAGDPEATSVLPPVAAAGPPDATRTLPPVVDDPYGGGPADGSYGGGPYGGAVHGEGSYGNGPRGGGAYGTSPHGTGPHPLSRTPLPRTAATRRPMSPTPAVRTPKARTGGRVRRRTRAPRRRTARQRGRGARGAAAGASGRPPGARRAARAQQRRSRGSLPWAALAACAAAGLAIGGILSVMGGDTEEPARGAAVAAATTPTASTAPAAASPSPSESPAESPGPSPTPTTAPPVPSGRFLLVHPTAGRALDVQEASVADGAPVILWDRHGGPNQQWLVSDLGDGHVQIHAAHSGLCLAGADPRTPGSAVVQRPCAPDNIAQRWQPTAPAGGSLHTLALQGTGLVLGASGPDNGAPLQLQQPDPAAPQAWSLEAVA
ncbi:RICIN domain-containing protein [Streptomyces sp. CC228A]|uniref:RICIN domain-containing protein n=1 Tax=Streptomyces sp. CC228A TaxID=2898186 RepID=UPI0027E53117|nr:RICIN domain-containing protein [Streptomyces sp. CC228A]